MLKSSIIRIIDYIKGLVLTPSLQACTLMAIGLCFTFVGYEYSRAASITLLAAEEFNFGSEALPFTVVVGSPMSALVLYCYTWSIKRLGSKITLRNSFIFCLFILGLMTFYSSNLKGVSGKIFVIFFYAFREIYVSLLSTQQWAFISSTLDKSTSNYLVSFSGFVSIASAFGGCTVEHLVGIGGVRWLLITTFFATLVGLCCAEFASTLVCVNNVHGHQAKNNNSSELSSEKKKINFWSDSWQLIKSHPILQVLFLEAVARQTCANMLNIMFHNGLRSSSYDDDFKAKMVGRFFATVNITACSLQLFVLPAFLTQSTLSNTFRHIPMVLLVAVMVGYFHPGMVSSMIGFGTLKVLEYSIMNAGSEMIYMPLGLELRYVGKELIKFFGHKLGKSSASLILSLLVNQLNPSLSIQSLWGAIFTMVWGSVMILLSSYIYEDAKKKKSISILPTSPDVKSNIQEKDLGRVRLSSSELRLRSSRSMPIFDIVPDDEDDENQYTINPNLKETDYYDPNEIVEIPNFTYALNEDDELIKRELDEDETTTNESESPPNMWYLATSTDPNDNDSKSNELNTEVIQDIHEKDFFEKYETLNQRFKSQLRKKISSQSLLASSSR